MFSYLIFWVVLQKLFEKMNKEGVMYKPAAAAADVDNDEQDVNSYSNGPQEKKKFVYKKESDSDGSVEPVVVWFSINISLSFIANRHSNGFSRGKQYYT